MDSFLTQFTKFSLLVASARDSVISSPSPSFFTDFDLDSESLDATLEHFLLLVVLDLLTCLTSTLTFFSSTSLSSTSFSSTLLPSTLFPSTSFPSSSISSSSTFFLERAWAVYLGDGIALEVFLSASTIIR